MKKLKNILFTLCELAKAAILTTVIYFLAAFIAACAYGMLGFIGFALETALMLIFVGLLVYVHASRYYYAKAMYPDVDMKKVDISLYPKLRRQKLRVWAFPLVGIIIVLVIHVKSLLLAIDIKWAAPLIPVFGAGLYYFCKSRCSMYEIATDPEKFKNEYEYYKNAYAGIEDAKNVCYVLTVLFIAAVCAAGNALEHRESTYRYSGHGFEYMNGYSTTDFNGYHVYDFPGKLAKLDRKSPFIIKNEADMPILDGAEACYPLYSAAAKAVYKNIAKTEKKYNRIYGDYGYNGKIVTFSNSSKGYERLIRGDADIFFGARPSREQKEKAAESGVKIISIPIAKEAFIFFVEKNNPINDISSDDLRKIYSGEIKNWNELCDYDKKIIAFQRPENSGSQVMMRFFMGDAKLKAPLTYEMGMGMGDVVTKVAQYADDEGALAYSFRYFVEELGQEKNVKILSVDGIAPTLENIENGAYPILADLVCAKLESNKKENTDKMIDFMLSEDGKTLIRKTGYAPVEGSERKEIIENEIVTEETT